MKLKMLDFGYQYITNKQVKIIVDFAIVKDKQVLKQFQKTATSRLKEPDQDNIKVGLTVARAKAERAAFKEFMNFAEQEAMKYNKLYQEASQDYDKALKEYNSQIEFLKSI